MLKNASFLITIGVDTAENEPRKESWVVARTGVSILKPEGPQVVEPLRLRPPWPQAVLWPCDNPSAEKLKKCMEPAETNILLNFFEIF